MSAIPEPWRDLMREIGKIKEQLRRLSNRSPFFGTGMHTNGLGGLDSDNYIPATSGFSLKGSTGVAEFKDIVLYDLPNSMLANPVEPDDVSFGVSNFSVPPGTYALLGSASRAVPDGYTKALVNASAWMFARNPNTSGGVDGTGTDAIFCFVRVTGSDGDTDSKPKGQGISGFGGFTTATSGVGKLKEGLAPGSSLTFKVYGASSSQTLAADAQNTADLMGTVLWLR